MAYPSSPLTSGLPTRPNFYGFPFSIRQFATKPFRPCGNTDHNLTSSIPSPPDPLGISSYHEPPVDTIITGPPLDEPPVAPPPPPLDAGLLSKTQKTALHYSFFPTARVPNPAFSQPKPHSFFSANPRNPWKYYFSFFQELPGTRISPVKKNISCHRQQAQTDKTEPNPKI